MAETLEATLWRLKDERDEADRRYNEALTALDKAFRGPSPLPAIPPGQDDRQITALNESWNILPAAPEFGGPAGKLKGFIWRVVAPFFQRQLTFNSQLVDHLNRNLAAQRASQRAIEETFATLNSAAAVLAEFESRLLVFLQQVTAYIDTKDRDHASGSLVLNAAMSAMADHLQRRWESIAATQARVQTRCDAMEVEHQELRSAIGIAQQAALSAKRQLERMGTQAELPETEGRRPAPIQPIHNRQGRSTIHETLNAYKYVGFENEFRGSRELIRDRLEAYVPYFDGASNVLDVGCGRGEFLDLLRDRGIGAKGIDLNPEMVDVCRARHLDVVEADAVSYLSTIADDSLDGLIAVQVVEHLEPDYLLQLLELAFHKLQPGGRLILETLNPACWVAFFESYIRDITHRWPVHPETLKYLVVASGFSSATLEFRSPVLARHRLKMLSTPVGIEAALEEIIDTFNANVEKLNSRMFTYLDYAVIGSK